ncbi:hypothetical protein SEA_PUPPER_11 [Gordonia phage Pupper]|uniref:Uncharacterized protein n=1 Tax=Gordonia phage Pupper TaxID=2571249 RepID=A0A4Y6EID6_9CAUD|nr:hypothetical protein KHQ83_gp011 [Gordonia phage Pupper]QDF18498.1 hypothetical protein SEA_PUPPER_11 [Gordonia phage Pupper]QDF18731.1 hypothetical protein SEA_SCENTAE_11 [Gordonia phage SCentae]
MEDTEAKLRADMRGVIENQETRLFLGAKDGDKQAAQELIGTLRQLLKVEPGERWIDGVTYREYTGHKNSVWIHASHPLSETHPVYGNSINASAMIEKGDVEAAKEMALARLKYYWDTALVGPRV